MSSKGSQFRFQYTKQKTQKWRSNSMPIKVTLKSDFQVPPPETYLRVHSIPFLIDRNSEHKRKINKMVGREEQLADAFEAIKWFLEDGNAPLFLSI